MKLLKQAGCVGCPLEHAGKYMVPDEVVEGAEVFGLAQNPGANEEAGRCIIGWSGTQPMEEDCSPAPLIGRTGWDLNKTFLPLAGLERGQISLGNTIRCRVGSTNDLPNPALLGAAAHHCNRAYLHIPDSTWLIVAIGEAAWNYTQGRPDLKIYEWRGHLGPVKFHGRPVFATLHIADLYQGRDPRMTLPTKMDWGKIPAILSGEHPRPLPPRLILGECGLDAVVEWFHQAMEFGSCVAWDTEYLYNQEDVWDANNYQLTMLSAAVPELDHGIQMVYMGGEADPYDKREFISRFYRLVTTKPSIFHNAKAEARSVHKTWGWDWRKVLWNFEDTMLAHAARWSEWPHTLDFVESIYSPYAKIKHLPTSDPERNWGDTCLTLAAWDKLKVELAHDPDSERVYREQSLKLVVPTLERDIAGIAVNQPFVLPALARLEKKVEDAYQMCHSAIGWPINLNSPKQMKDWLKLNGMVLKKHKHSRKETLNKDAVAELRQKISPFDAEWEAKVGANTDYVTQRIVEGADPVLEARAFFVRADKLAGNYLRPLVVNA